MKNLLTLLYEMIKELKENEDIRLMFILGLIGGICFIIVYSNFVSNMR